MIHNDAEQFTFTRCNVSVLIITKTIRMAIEI